MHTPELVTIRTAALGDVEALVALFAQLGYPVDGEGLESRLRRLLSESPLDAVYVASVSGQVAGVVVVHVEPMLHQECPLGRITALVVDASHRQLGVGRKLVAAAERFLHAAGCARVEVTSAEHRGDAHRFYVGLGFREKRIRFVKDRH